VPRVRQLASSIRRRQAAPAVAALIAALALAALGSEAGRAGTPATPPDASRIAWVRAYQHGKWTVRGETAESVGAALAQLRPTYVTSLIRLAAGERVTNYEVKAWETIRAAVRATSPEAEFAIELNALEYPKIAKLNAMMAKVRARFGNEGWLFDFYTTAAKRKPKVMAAAVANAHANGEWIGGNAFGIAKNPRFPAQTDFLEVQDTDFRINLNAVRELAEKVQVHFHLGNSPAFPRSSGCQFIKQLSTARRQAYVTRRAGQQAAYDFRFGYPVFFPECYRKPSNPQTRIVTYNAPDDDPMMETIGQLMDQFD
jgi:hypothetical protein